MFWDDIIISNYVIEPYFFEKTVNSEVYLDFRANHWPVLL